MIFSIEKKPGDAQALVSSDHTRVTYGELCAFTAEMGQFLSGRSLVFCLCENAPGAVAGYLAMLETHQVPLLLEADLRREQLDAFYRVYEPSWFWAPVGSASDLAGYGCEKVYEAYGYCLWKTGFTPAPMHEKLGILLATSGSTGQAKLVRLSRTNLEVNAASICAYLDLDERERPITTLPMQYTYGLSIINSHLLAGGCILMTKDSYVQKGFWDFFAEQAPTSFGGVPYTYEILKKMRIFRSQLPSLRTVTQAGGKLSEDLQTEVAQWADKYGVRFFVMYGQTEATARMAYLPSEHCLEKPGSIGIAVPGGKFSLADEQNRPVAEAFVEGELIYEGANVSLGYARRKEDLLLGDENNGILHTGDLAKRDADGYYYIVGRKKRFVKIFGVRVGLDACEQILRRRFPDAEIACVGSDDHLEIYVTDRETADGAADYLSEYLRLNRKGFAAFYLEELPKNESGKTRYAQLAQGSGR